MAQQQDRAPDAAIHNLHFFGPEIGNGTARGIDHPHVEGHKVRTRTEHRGLLRQGARGCPEKGEHQKGGSPPKP